MANRDNPSGFKWIRSAAGNTPLVDVVTLAGTVAKGDALVNGGSGTYTIALSNSGTIHGVAAMAGVSGDEIDMYAAGPQNEFEAQCSSTFAATMNGYAVDIEGTTGIQEVNEDGTTEKVFQITGYNHNDSIGANTRVRGYFVRASYNDTEDAE
jgi:hypothetical protein